MGHIIAVVGGKGGVGKSVFAANLAIAYQLNFKQRSLILDLDFQSLGDQNIILGLNTPKTIVDLSKTQVAQWDPKTLAPFMVNASQGYSFIGAPREAALARDLDIDGLGKFLKAATQIFPWVVVDCGNGTEPHALKALEQATLIFVVTSPDVIVINQTRRILTKIQELMFPPDMVQIIVNRFSANNVINPQIIQKNLGKVPFFAIPDEVATCENALAKSQPFTLTSPSAPISRAFSDLVRRIDQSKMLDQLSKLNKPTGVAAKLQVIQGGPVASAVALSASEGNGALLSRSRSAPVDPWTSMKLRAHKALIDVVDMKKMSSDMADPKQKEVLREKTLKAVLDVLNREDLSTLCPSQDLRKQLVKEILDEALGLGPLEDLLADDSVTEIMVNARDQIYVEQSGKNGMSKVTFSSELQMMNVIERIVTPLGRRVDEKTPYVDARLSDGSRVHIIIPPLALRGPTITIRKFPKKRFVADDLIKFGSITKEIADFLRLCVEGKLNIVISGGTGSGKTTLLNVLSNFIPASDRIITVEDAAELQLGQDHVVRLETRPKNIEGEGEVSIRDLIKCCLRMKPDRIVVGECRGGETLDMLQAMNTGHAGSLTSVHSNNPRECLGRLETLVMMAGMGLPLKAIRETMSTAVNLIIQQSRLSDGSKKVTHISEVIGMQGDTITLQDIFVFKQEGLDKNRKIVGRFVPTGFIPKFVEEMEAKGMKVSRGLFAAK